MWPHIKCFTCPKSYKFWRCYSRAGIHMDMDENTCWYMCTHDIKDNFTCVIMKESLWKKCKAIRFMFINMKQQRVSDTPRKESFLLHYSDVTKSTMASQINSLKIVYSTVYSGADQRKHQSSASLAFVRVLTCDRRIPRTKGQLRGKCFHLMTSSCGFGCASHKKSATCIDANMFPAKSERILSC